MFSTSVHALPPAFKKRESLPFTQSNSANFRPSNLTQTVAPPPPLHPTRNPAHALKILKNLRLKNSHPSISPACALRLHLLEKPRTRPASPIQARKKLPPTKPGDLPWNRSDRRSKSGPLRFFPAARPSSARAPSRECPSAKREKRGEGRAQPPRGQDTCSRLQDDGGKRANRSAAVFREARGKPPRNCGAFLRRGGAVFRGAHLGDPIRRRRSGIMMFQKRKEAARGSRCLRRGGGRVTSELLRQRVPRCMRYELDGLGGIFLFRFR